MRNFHCYLNHFFSFYKKIIDFSLCFLLKTHIGHEVNTFSSLLRSCITLGATSTSTLSCTARHVIFPFETLLWYVKQIYNLLSKVACWHIFYFKWTGVTNQQAEMMNLTQKPNDVIYNRADTLKSDSD